MTRISTLTTAFHHNIGSSSQHTKARKYHAKYTYLKGRNKLFIYLKLVCEKVFDKIHVCVCIYIYIYKYIFVYVNIYTYIFI